MERSYGLVLFTHVQWQIKVWNLCYVGFRLKMCENGDAEV